MRAHWALTAAALWWGSLLATGLVILPVLLAALPHPLTAMQVGAQLWQAQSWISIACTVFILSISRPKGSELFDPWAQAAMGFAIAGLLLTLVMVYGILPRMLSGQGLTLWRALGAGLFAGQCGCAFMTFWRIARR